MFVKQTIYDVNLRKLESVTFYYNKLFCIKYKFLIWQLDQKHFKLVEDMNGTKFTIKIWKELTK